MAPEEASSIASLSNACLISLDRLYFLLKGSPDKEREFEIKPSKLYDELARFKIWGDSIGAFQSTEAAVSLAQRLKNAPRTAAQVVELLQDMKEALEDGEFISECNIQAQE